MPSIGKLIEVDVRELWKHEQYDFSNWLAKDVNLEYLNDILGLTLSQLAESNVERRRRADTFIAGRGVPIGNYVRPITFIIKKEQRL